MWVVYQFGQSSICGGAVRWCYRKSRHRSGPDRKWRNRKYFLRMRNRYILSYYYSNSTKCSTVVQVPGLPEVFEGHVTPKGGWKGVRMRNRKLRNIRPCGAFWPEVTLWNVTRSDITWPRRGFPWVRCTHVQPEVAQYPPYWCLFNGPEVIKRHPYSFPWNWKLGLFSRTSASIVF